MKLDLFAVIIIAVVVLVGGYALYIQIKTKRKGIETEAEIINVTERWDRTDDFDTLCYDYTVEYTNDEGKTITAALGGMSDANKHLQAGDRIVIKYLKEKQEYPLLVKKL
ncbi:MAG: hypothetical protein K6B12_05700 [Clostridiales bacterium]|nr:hypothetical protein [Clostridiales bacterium]